MNSRNLDFLRSSAVLLVVGFHLAKYFNWQRGGLQIADFGLLGVMLFFVHTTLVLMFSLERQRANSSSPLFLPFMLRRCFRIYPLAIIAVTFVYIFRIPSDLQFGRFDLVHQTAGNLVANLLLIQNVTRQKANPGPLWSLPLELQMYLVLPGLIFVCIAPEISMGSRRALVRHRRLVVLRGDYFRIAATKRGWRSVAHGSIPEIHAIRAVLSSRYRRLQTLAKAEAFAGFSVACIPSGLLRSLRVVLRESAHRGRLVHLLWHRSGSDPFPRIARELDDPAGSNCGPILLWHLLAPLFRAIWLWGFRAARHPLIFGFKLPSSFLV